MNQIILASHGGLAAGARDTLEMVLGDVSNVHVVSLQRDDKEPITKAIEALIESFDESDAVYVCTDMSGSSVNNSVVELMDKGGRFTAISGMNMPLVLSLAIAPGPLTREEIADIVRDSRAGIDRCGDSILMEAAERKRVVSGKGGKADIVLARLDYRLLHGQVVFSWVNSVGASRIIVVDDEAANDEIKKGALKLAKPAGVYLNVFTVKRALAKMEKLNTLGEKVMFVFGNVDELLEFVSSYRLPEINFGAAANHDGAEPVGGRDSSVFLDARERATAQKILDLGIKIFEQQTPTHVRTDINSF
ncbi:MAG: PTS sugar transporter subunit IIB [Collinsella sp.]|nr:PTS sugar transporter subunit IIB [Collinsella sp.]